MGITTSFTLYSPMTISTTRRQAILNFLGHPFWSISTVSDTALARYDQALTQDSYANEQRDRGIVCKHYQRLEFLGDRILNHAVAEFLFHNYADNEGILTEKVKFTKNENLAYLAKAKNLGISPPLLLLGRGQSLEDSIIADVFEALLAAIYLDPDGGMDKIHQIVRHQLGADIHAFEPGSGNPKADLQICIQQQLKIDQLTKDELVYVKLRDEIDPDNRHTFTVEVKILGRAWGQGQGSNLKKAEQAAAQAALSHIEAGNSPFF